MINKNTAKYFLLSALCFLLVIFFASGCGGGLFNGGASRESSARSQGGAVTFNFNSGGGKYIASNTSSLYISITGEGLSSATTKTAAYSSSSVTFDNLPVGNKTAQISALDALENTISSGRVSFVIEGGRTNSASVALGIVFTDSSFSPSGITIPANTTLYFYNAGNSAHRLSGSSSVFNNNLIASQASTAVSFTSAGNYICYLDGSSSGISCTITIGSPQITSISPSSGVAGASVTISGTNFGLTHGTSTVTFNGTAVTSVTSWSDTSIVCNVPSGASTGNVVVTVNGTESNSVNFMVLADPGTILVSYTSNWGGAAGLRRIYTLSPDGSTFTQLYALAGYEFYQPIYNKDYTKIVLSGYKFGVESRIMSINSDGTNPQVILSNANWNTYSNKKASWSPDSTKIAYNTFYIANVITSATSFLVAGWGTPSWSPINDQILFLTGSSPNLNVNKISELGGPTTTIKTINPYYAGQGTTSAIWSPDGTKIAVNYSADPLGLVDTVIIMDTNGTVLSTKQLSSDELDSGGWNTSPTTFTPDGNYLLLSSSTTIRKMDVNTGDLTVLFTRPDPTGFILGCCYAAK